MYSQTHLTLNAYRVFAKSICESKVSKISTYSRKHNTTNPLWNYCKRSQGIRPRSIYGYLECNGKRIRKSNLFLHVCEHLKSNMRIICKHKKSSNGLKEVYYINNELISIQTNNHHVAPGRKSRGFRLSSTTWYGMCKKVELG